MVFIVFVDNRMDVKLLATVPAPCPARTDMMAPVSSRITPCQSLVLLEA